MHVRLTRVDSRLQPKLSESQPGSTVDALAAAHQLEERENLARFNYHHYLVTCAAYGHEGQRASTTELRQKAVPQWASVLTS